MFAGLYSGIHMLWYPLLDLQFSFEPACGVVMAYYGQSQLENTHTAKRRLEIIEFNQIFKGFKNFLHLYSDNMAGAYNTTIRPPQKMDPPKNYFFDVSCDFRGKYLFFNEKKILDLENFLKKFFSIIFFFEHFFFEEI